ncbi:MAG: hypothetical protein LDL33_15525 [Desulfomonile sp.]|nr:hypothetical protein [Desulfomonile sp.]
MELTDTSGGRNEILQQAPAALLGQIREYFSAAGLLGATLSLKHQGQWYRISCDDDVFMVYRVNSGLMARHHVPGWPVCMVTRETIFEEHHAPGLGDDHCACGADIARWMRIIREHQPSSTE